MLGKFTTTFCGFVSMHRTYLAARTYRSTSADSPSHSTKNHRISVGHDATSLSECANRSIAVPSTVVVAPALS